MPAGGSGLSPWCVAILRKVVPARRSEQPYDPRQPAIWLDEKPVTPMFVPPPGPTGAGRQTGKRIRTLRHSQHLLYRGPPKRIIFSGSPRWIVQTSTRPKSDLGLPVCHKRSTWLCNLGSHRQEILATVFGEELAVEVWNRFAVPYIPRTAVVCRRFRAARLSSGIMRVAQMW